MKIIKIEVIEGRGVEKYLFKGTDVWDVILTFLEEKYDPPKPRRGEWNCQNYS